MSKGLATSFPNTGSTNIDVICVGGSINVPVVVSVRTMTLPTSEPTTIVPTVTGISHICNTTSDFTSALLSASLGDEIVLTAGNTFTGPFTLPNKTSGSGWILIRSSATGSLPARNTRVHPADAINMAAIVTNDNFDPALLTAPSSHHYWFLGIEFSFAGGVTSNFNLISFGDGSPTQNLTSLMPHDLALDRCYIHGNSAVGFQRGLGLNCGTTTIIDNYFGECHNVGNDAQALAGWNGSGPYLIQNNYLEGSGENIIFGGADPAISGSVPSDITIRGNHFYKPPGWYLVWEVKNLLEFKLGKRVLIENNVFENCWLDAQVGTGIVIGSTDQGGTAPWSETSNVTFQNNIVKNVAQGFSISATPNPGNGPVVPCFNVKLYNNLIYGVGSIDGNYSSGGADRMFELAGVYGLMLEHNTAITSQNYGFCFTSNVPIQQLVVSDNILGSGDNVIDGNGLGFGTAALMLDALPGWVFRRNIVVGVDSSTNPTDNFYPPDQPTLGLDPITHKLPSGSQYMTAATDGTMIGANIDAVNAATSGAIASNKARVTFVSNFDSTNATGTGSYKSPTFNAVAGNTIVVGVKGLAVSGFSPTITDTALNTYNLVDSDHISGGNGIALYECHNCLGNASNQVQFAGTGSTFKTIAVAQYSGCQRKVSPLDVVVGGHGAASGSYTTTPAINGNTFDEIMVLLATDSLGGTITIPSTFTTRTTSGITFADQLIPNVYNQTAVITSSSGSDVNQAILAVFR